LIGAPAVVVEFALRRHFGYQWALTIFEMCVIFSLFLIFGFGPERKGHDFHAQTGGFPMGSISVACYRPKPGCDEALLVEVRDHLPPLRAAGLVTERACKSGAGTNQAVARYK
jgi:hypothetical protein